MSVLAETADLTYSGNAAIDRAEVRQETQKFAEAAIANSKREGLLLAVRARWVALAVTAVTLPIVTPNWEVIYYVVMLIPFALIGWAQRKVGKAGPLRSGAFPDVLRPRTADLPRLVPNPVARSTGRSACSSISTPSAISISFWPPRRSPIHGER